MYCFSVQREDYLVKKKKMKKVLQLYQPKPG